MTERKIRGKESSWLTQEIKNLMHTRDWHLRRFKCTKSKTDWDNYKRYRNTINNKTRIAKANNIQNSLRDSKDTPSTFWSHIDLPSKRLKMC